MTYQLSSEELEQVKELVRILANAHYDVGVLGPEQEREAMRIAINIDRWLK